MKTDYEIKVGESFQFELDTNPSTGYSWNWSNQQSVSIVELTDKKFISNRPNGPGAGGMETWFFKGLKSGSDILKLEYKRGWETGPAVKVISINVTVK